MLQKILDKIKNQPITISQWVVGFTGIFFIRYFFESLSSPTSSGIIPSDPYTFIHVGLFFLSVTLGTACIIGYFTKDYLNAPKIILFGLPVIWLAPILDIIISRGQGYKMTYIFDTGKSLVFDFFTFFGPSLNHGATYGIRIGIVIILIGIVWYLWFTTKNLFRSILGGFSAYILGFILASIPGILYTISHIYDEPDTIFQVLSYLEKIILQSNIVHNTLREGVSFVSETRFFELGFDKLLSQILFIICVIFVLFLFWKIDSKKFRAIIKNSRLERLNFYLASILCGMGFAYINKLGNSFIWTDVLGITCLLISWSALWMHAVHVNDVADIEIDKISNANRPLIKKETTAEDMRETGNVWLAVALLGSWSAGFYPFFMSLVYIAASYIYSSPPLRLRRFPIVSSFLIAVACLSTVLAGFFFISIYKEIRAFPIFLAMGIIIMVTLAINFKDIKDILGDRANGIITLPILFGENGIRVVGICFALSILLVPIFLSFYLLYIIALPAAIIGFKLVTKKPYKEGPIFILRFIFITGIALFYLVAYWLTYM